jgi:hypothetical protein
MPKNTRQDRHTISRLPALRSMSKHTNTTHMLCECQSQDTSRMSEDYDISILPTWTAKSNCTSTPLLSRPKTFDQVGMSCAPLIENLPLLFTKLEALQYVCETASSLQCNCEAGRMYRYEKCDQAQLCCSFEST